MSRSIASSPDPWRRTGRGIARRAGRWLAVRLILGLAGIGLFHLTRGTAVPHVRGVAPDGVAIGVDEPEFPLMATLATGAWLAPGPRVEITQNGDGTYARLWDDLRGRDRRSSRGRGRRAVGQTVAMSQASSTTANHSRCVPAIWPLGARTDSVKRSIAKGRGALDPCDDTCHRGEEVAAAYPTLSTRRRNVMGDRERLRHTSRAAWI